MCPEQVGGIVMRVQLFRTEARKRYFLLLPPRDQGARWLW